VTSANPILTSLTAARQMLAACHYWRRLADGEPWTEAESLAHVHLDALPPPAAGGEHTREELEALRPFAIVSLGEDEAVHFDLDSSGNCCVGMGGSVDVYIELPVPAELRDTPSALAADVYQRIGRVLRTANAAEPGLVELAGLPGYLALRRATMRAYYRTTRQERHEIGDATCVHMTLMWGRS
jgi:hypothetical protein